jgi:hypothetical protein
VPDRCATPSTPRPPRAARSFSRSPEPSPLASNLNRQQTRVTIAGQTAPGGGICLKNYTLRVDANDIVVRHIRSRLGTDANREDDAITVTGAEST